MSTDFKALWNQEKSPVPDIDEIFAKANKLNRTMRHKIFYQHIVLTFTAIFVTWVLWDANPKMLTTKIGVLMVDIGIIIYLIATNQMHVLLQDSDTSTNSRQYLTQMMRVKQKQDFLDTTIMSLYFIFLTGGLGLYMLEYALKGGLVFRISVYGVCFLWMGICWFYIVPKGIKRKRKAINEIISRLEEVDGQLGEQ